MRVSGSGPTSRDRRWGFRAVEVFGFQALVGGLEARRLGADKAACQDATEGVGASLAIVGAESGLSVQGYHCSTPVAQGFGSVGPPAFWLKVMRDLLDRL